MAISAVNLKYSGQGPSASGQILAQAGGGDHTRALDAYGTATGDGASTTFVVNFIDGTATLPFTPNGIFASRVVASTDTAATTISVAAAGGAVSNTGATLTCSAAPANGALLSFCVRIIK